jgi:glycosyltransferase involved in cell wall biosynthesis
MTMPDKFGGSLASGRRLRLGTRIVHLSSVHRDDDVRIFLKECRTLAQEGFEVEYVVPTDRGGPRDGVTIIPVKCRRGRMARLFKVTLDIFIASRRRRASIYHLHDPELIPVGLLLRLLGKRVIYDVHEDVPRDILGKHWIPRWARPCAAFVAACAEWFAARALSGIIAATPAIADRFPKRRTSLIRNLPLQSEFAAPREKCDAARPVAVYVGLISVARGAGSMVRAINAVRDSSIRLTLVGEMDPPSLLEELKQLPGWDRVSYLGWKDRGSVVNLLATASVGLVLLHPTACFVTSQPIKLFEYMAGGIPIIASDFPLWRQLVVETGCGLCVPPEDADAVAEAIEWILGHPADAEEMGRRGQALVRDEMNWEREAVSLTSLYARLLGSSGAPETGCSTRSVSASDTPRDCVCAYRRWR